MTQRPPPRRFIPTGPTGSAARPHVDVVFWSVTGLVLTALFLSFRSFVLREIAWAYPASYDQTKYLGITYSAFEVLAQRGFGEALSMLFRGAYENGMLIHLEALGLFVFFGASRLTALSVNYLHLAIYAAVFAWSAKRLTGSRRLGFLALGLAFSTGPFWFNLLIDYRLDFSASCVFGLFVSLVMASRVFRSRNESWAAGVVAGIMMMTRFLTSLYIGGIYAVMAGYFFGRLVLRRGDEHDRARLYHLVGSGIVALVVAMPVLWLNHMAIYNYYVVEQGRQAAIRAIEFPAGGAVEALLYYPKSVMTGHVGAALAASSLAVLALAAAVAFRRGLRGRPRAAALVPFRESYVFLIVCALIVVGALTANITRSPIVGGILAPVFSWGVMLTFFACLGPWLSAGDRVAQRACAAAALLAIVVGAGTQLRFFVRHMTFTQLRMDATQIVDLYDAMGLTSERAGWRTPLVAADSMRDYFVAGSPTAVYYERHGALIQFTGILGASGSPLPQPHDALMSQVKQAHFVILTHRREAVEPPYPSVDDIEAIRPQMETFARTEMVHLGAYDIYGRHVDLYARPSDGHR